MKPTGNSAHARCQKGGVPEAAEIGRTPIKEFPRDVFQEKDPYRTMSSGTLAP